MRNIHEIKSTTSFIYYCYYYNIVVVDDSIKYTGGTIDGYTRQLKESIQKTKSHNAYDGEYNNTTVHLTRVIRTMTAGYLNLHKFLYFRIRLLECVRPSDYAHNIYIRDCLPFMITQYCYDDVITGFQNVFSLVARAPRTTVVIDPSRRCMTAGQLCLRPPGAWVAKDRASNVAIFLFYPRNVIFPLDILILIDSVQLYTLRVSSMMQLRK